MGNKQFKTNKYLLWVTIAKSIDLSLERHCKFWVLLQNRVASEPKPI